MAKRGPRASSAVGRDGRAALRKVLRESGRSEARTIPMLESPGVPTVGVFHRALQGGKVVPADRRNRVEYRVPERDASGAEDGEWLVPEPLAGARLGARRARIVRRLGHSSDAGVISLLAIATHDIPTEFPLAAIAGAEAAPPARFAGG